MVKVVYEKKDLRELAEEAYAALTYLVVSIESMPRSNKTNITECWKGAVNTRRLIAEMLKGDTK